MAELNYTKGDLGGWRNQGGTIMTDSHNNRKVIARVENNKAFTVEQVIANAQLIASAPDLYEALENLVFYVTNDGVPWSQLKVEIAKAQNALAKAKEGE